MYLIFFNVVIFISVVSVTSQTDDDKDTDLQHLSRQNQSVLLSDLVSQITNGSRRYFNNALMYYCDPIWCKSYNKEVCGFNRKNTKFRWFQSFCHLLLNNYCSTYRGFYKFDVVEKKFCTEYVLHLREGCPNSCPSTKNPLCAISQHDGHLVLFKNRCYFEMAACTEGAVHEYKKTTMAECVEKLNTSEDMYY